MSQLGTRVQNTDGKLKITEEKFNQSVGSIQKKIGQLKTDSGRLYSTYEEMRLNFEKQMDAKNKQQAALLHKFKKAIEGAVSLRKQSENRIFRYLQEKTYKLGQQLTAESRARAQAVANLQSIIEQDLPKLQKMLVQAKRGRQGGDKQIMHAIGQQIRKASDVLQNSKKTKDKQSNKTYEMIRQLAAKIKTQLQDEEKMRLSCHQNLLHLIEQACAKLACSSV